MESAEMFFERIKNLTCDVEGCVGFDLCRGDTPLIHAARYGHVEKVRVLLEDGADIEEVDMVASLHVASWGGYLDVCRLLLEAGVNVDVPDVHGETVLFTAVFNEDLDMCHLFLDWGANVNRQDYGEYCTPLHLAAEGGHLPVVKLLVERGADVSLKSSDGQTAMVIARRRGKKVVARWLGSARRG